MTAPPAPYDDAEWRERLNAAVAETIRARRARHDQAAEHKRRRDHGLRARHAARLARANQRLAQAQADGPEDSWWEEP